MKFKIEVRHHGTSEVWWETFDKEEVTDEATAKAWAIKTIARFNDTLRPKELPREFAGGVLLLGAGTRKHDWSKMNLYTIEDHRGHYDNVECKNCGARARRYGLDRIKRQKGYTARKWDNCPGQIKK